MKTAKQVEIRAARSANHHDRKVSNRIDRALVTASLEEIEQEIKRKAADAARARKTKENADREAKERADYERLRKKYDSGK